MKKYYIYLTTNLINGMKYIGQHYGKLDDSYIGSGNDFKKAVSEFGRENFKKEILEVCDSYTTLNEAEKKWIKKFDAVTSKEFYNIASGGGNSNPIAGMDKEKRKIRSEKLSKHVQGEKNYFYGKHFCGESHPRYGKHHSNESKEKMRQAKLGGKAPTAKSIAIYDLDGNFIQKFETQREFKIFLGLSPNGSTDTLKKYIQEGKPYHGYIVKYI